MKHLTSGVEILLPDPIGSQDDSGTRFTINSRHVLRGKVYIEVPHYTWFESFRYYEHKHFFTFGSFDYFIKGNPYYRTEFRLVYRRIFFDDFTNTLGIGFLANWLPRIYEKRFAFSAISFCVLTIPGVVRSHANLTYTCRLRGPSNSQK